MLGRSGGCKATVGQTGREQVDTAQREAVFFAVGRNQRAKQGPDTREYQLSSGGRREGKRKTGEEEEEER